MTAYFHTPFFLSSPIQHALPHILRCLLTTCLPTTLPIVFFSGIILNNLSDHLPVFAYFDDATLTRSTERKIVMRTFKDDYLHKFNENLSNAKWSSFRNMEDPNEAYNDFIEEYSRIYNTCFPLKVLKGKQVNKFFSPWLSPGLLKSVNKKNRLYRKFVTLPSTSSETKY